MTLKPIPNVTAAAPAAPVKDESGEPVTAPKVLLMGPPGSGKTWSTSTLLAAGIEVFYLATEPNAIDVVLDACNKKNIPIDRFHWNYVPPSTASWKSMKEVSRIINTNTYQGVTDIKSGIEKVNSNAIMDVLNCCENFYDQRTKKYFGDVTSWGFDRALVLDSLSGLNILAQRNTVGLKPTLAQGEWNIAMNLEEMFINKLTADMRAYFIVLAHIERNIDQTSGRMIITPLALGAKLGPRLGRFFSEVVLTVKDGDKFSWTTMEKNADVKQRSLPIANGLAPSFDPVVKAFNNRLKTLHATDSAPPAVPAA